MKGSRKHDTITFEIAVAHIKIEKTTNYLGGDSAQQYQFWTPHQKDRGKGQQDCLCLGTTNAKCGKTFYWKEKNFDGSDAFCHILWGIDMVWVSCVWEDMLI